MFVKGVEMRNDNSKVNLAILIENNPSLWYNKENNENITINHLHKESNLKPKM